MQVGATWSFEVSDALPTATIDSFAPSLSPRLAASGPQNKVGKGIRHNGSVISGKALALWVVFRVPVLRTEMLGKLLDASQCRVDSRVGDNWLTGNASRCFPCTMNNQLRTGWMENPTVESKTKLCDCLKW